MSSSWEEAGATAALTAVAKLPACLYRFMDCTFCSLPDPWPIGHYKFIFPDSQKGMIKQGEVITIIYSGIKNSLNSFFLDASQGLYSYLYLCNFIFILCWDTKSKQKMFNCKGFFTFAQIELLKQYK